MPYVSPSTSSPDYIRRGRVRQRRTFHLFFSLRPSRDRPCPRFQSTWLERAAAACAASTRAARELRPRTDNDDQVAALRGSMAQLLVAAERADADGE